MLLPSAELRTGAGGPLLVIRSLRRPQPRLGLGDRALALELFFFLSLGFGGGALCRFGSALVLLGSAFRSNGILPRLLLGGSLRALVGLGGLPAVDFRLLRRGFLGGLRGRLLCL